MSHGQEHSTWSCDDVHLDIMARIAETSEQLSSAAEAGNWNLVRELISNEHNVVLAIQQSCLLHKFASLTKISYQLVKDILKQIFSNMESSQNLKVQAKNAAVEAARCGNWDTLIVFLWSVEGLLEDDSSLRSVILTIADSQTLREKRYLHIDVLSAVWRNSKQTILDSTDKTVHNTLVQLAAKVNMWSRVCDLLVTKPDLNLLDRDGQSVLHRLVMCHDSRFDSLLSRLLENGADVNLKTANGDTALHLATEHQKLRKVQYILRLEHNSDEREYLKARNKYRNKNAESKNKALELFFKDCRNVDDKNRDGNTAAILAARIENWHFLKLLLKHGANVNVLDSHQHSVLHILALKRPSFYCESLATECIKHGAQVDREDENGRSPLHLAVDSQNWTLCKLLIEHGANHDIRDQDNSNVLHRLTLADSKHVEEVMSLFSLLQSRGANINATGPSGNTILHLAAKQRNWTLLQHLLHLGAACINSYNENGFTVIHILASDPVLETDHTKNENLLYGTKGLEHLDHLISSTSALKHILHPGSQPKVCQNVDFDGKDANGSLVFLAGFKRTSCFSIVTQQPV
ncbi:hypothetical protein C0Q70_12225 [Pomacea canaliculata]|uniref:Uncharacterized protein n=1 Tax=Pomacea canaliculata TaxID=400727 RepID=A0A2T7P0X8_POMCA|nr:hypothetical protein C0Q70_12225 [Pomacea canaliculata]